MHVKLDTGMGRWGVSELPPLGPNVVGLMTHLATADSDPDFARTQIERFRDATAQHAHLTRHVANSAAALGLPEARFDAARCGIALYGLSPFGTDPAEDGLRPVLSWTSELATVRLLRAGQSTGYGRGFVAERDTWIGIVPVGYADGFRRDLAGTEVLVAGEPRRVVGVVSMDAFAVELGRELAGNAGDDRRPRGAARRACRGSPERSRYELASARSRVGPTRATRLVELSSSRSRRRQARGARLVVPGTRCQAERCQAERCQADRCQCCGAACQARRAGDGHTRPEARYREARALARRPGAGDLPAGKSACSPNRGHGRYQRGTWISRRSASTASTGSDCGDELAGRRPGAQQRNPDASALREAGRLDESGVDREARLRSTRGRARRPDRAGERELRVLRRRVRAVGDRAGHRDDVDGACEPWREAPAGTRAGTTGRGRGS